MLLCCNGEVSRMMPVASRNAAAHHAALMMSTSVNSRTEYANAQHQEAGVPVSQRRVVAAAAWDD